MKEKAYAVAEKELLRQSARSKCAGGWTGAVGASAWVYDVSVCVLVVGGCMSAVDNNQSHDRHTKATKTNKKYKN